MTDVAPIRARLAIARGDWPAGAVPQRVHWREAYAHDVAALLALVDTLADGRYAAYEILARRAERRAERRPP